MFLQFGDNKIINLEKIVSIFLYEADKKYIICFESILKNKDPDSDYISNYDYEINFKTELEALTYFAKLKYKLNLIEIN